MAIILSIDTSLEEAKLAITSDGNILSVKKNSTQYDHASWIHTAVRSMSAEAGVGLSALDAIAVTSGPGSYTGLRVGMATAKGLCYALKKPLLTENTLKLTAYRARKLYTSKDSGAPVVFCPMIDARRMEVFTATFDEQVQQLTAPSAMILNENAFAAELALGTVVFCGNGAEKWKNICNHTNAVYIDAVHEIDDLAEIAAEKFKNGLFSELAYTEPDYFKNVYTGK